MARARNGMGAGAAYEIPDSLWEQIVPLLPPLLPFVPPPFVPMSALRPARALPDEPAGR